MLPDKSFTPIALTVFLVGITTNLFKLLHSLLYFVGFLTCISYAALHWFQDYLTEMSRSPHILMADEGWHFSRQCFCPPLILVEYPSIITTGTLLQYANDTTLIYSGSNPVSVAATMNYLFIPGQSIARWNIIQRSLLLCGNSPTIVDILQSSLLLRSIT